MSDDKILQFPGAADLPEQPMRVEREPGWCAHDKIILDTHRRMVRCAKCEKVIDPFDYLANEAIHIQRAWDDYRHVKKKLGETAERVDALEKEEKRLKARVKTARAKVEPVLDLRSPRPL